MWVIFRKSDNEVVGMSADSEIDLVKEEALAEVVRGLAIRKEGDEFDAIQVTDRDKKWSVSRAFGRRGAKVVAKEGGAFEVVDETPESTTVVITTDATQFHPVDNVPLIPADGTSFLVITLQKATLQGTPLAREAIDNEVIWLRTTCGSLREATTGPVDDERPGVEGTERPPEIRSVALASGTARFRIYSETARRLAAVEMLSANPELRLGGFRVEFI